MFYIIPNVIIKCDLYTDATYVCFLLSSSTMQFWPGSIVRSGLFSRKIRYCSCADFSQKSAKCYDYTIFSSILRLSRTLNQQCMICNSFPFMEKRDYTPKKYNCSSYKKQKKTSINVNRLWKRIAFFHDMFIHKKDCENQTQLIIMTGFLSKMFWIVVSDIFKSHRDEAVMAKPPDVW